MPSYFTLLVFGLVAAVGSVRAEPAIEIRLIRTDPAAAGIIRTAVQEGRFTATEIGGRLDKMISGGKAREIARFKQAAIASGSRIEFRKDDREFEVADGIRMPMGITLEIEPTLGPDGLVDLRFSFSNKQSARKNRIEVDSTMAAVTLKADEWQVIAAWGDASESMLLMAHVSGHEAETETMAASNSLREIFCDGELMLCDPNDLKTFGRSTPATRAKAVGWLRERGELVATSGFGVHSGQIATQKDALDWIHEIDNGWDTAQLGLEINLRGQVDPFGETVDLDVFASWSPLDARKPEETPHAEFRHGETTSSGTTIVIEAKARPEKGPVPVLFLTPHNRTLREAKAMKVSQVDAKPGDLTTRRYPVHPSFLRKLGAEGGAQAVPAPPMILPAQPPKALLERMGMAFPAGTNVVFIPSDCQILLSHNSEGHARFVDITNRLGVAVPDRPQE